MSDITFRKVLFLDDNDIAVIPYVLPATDTELGVVKPDGTSITVDDDGTLHSSTSLSGDVGSSVNPIYLDNGELKASTSTLGASTLPLYMSNGTLKQCSRSIPDPTTFVLIEDLVQVTPVVEAYEDASSGTWWRVYADRFCIMSGTASRIDVNPKVITLPRDGGYIDSTYRVFVSFEGKVGIGNTNMSYCPYTSDKTNVSFKIGYANDNATNFPVLNWIAYGHVGSL